MIIGKPKLATWEKSVSVTVVLKRARFSDQPVYNVPVVDMMLTFTSKPGHTVYAFLPIPYFNVIGVKSDINMFFNEPAVNRIGIVNNAYRAGWANFHPESAKSFLP